MRILSLSLFQKFVEIRACGHQRPPDVAFWLKLVSVLGFKNTVVISLKTASQRYVVGKRKKSFCCLLTQIREIWFGHPLKIESNSTAVDFAAQSAVQQCNSFHNEPVTLITLTPQKGFAPS